MDLKERNEMVDNKCSSKLRSNGGRPCQNHVEGPPSNSLPFASKLILYGMCGLFVEVMFTAIWYFVDSVRYKHGWKLHGCSSVWSFPIYGISCFIVEKMFLAMDGKIPLLFRGIVYLAWTYVWEFSTGLLLRQFDACPWDYDGYTYFNVMGLITFDYAPLWYTGCLLLEISVIQSALALQYRGTCHTKDE